MKRTTTRVFDAKSPGGRRVSGAPDNRCGKPVLGAPGEMFWGQHVCDDEPDHSGPHHVAIGGMVHFSAAPMIKPDKKWIALMAKRRALKLGISHRPEDPMTAAELEKLKAEVERWRRRSEVLHANSDILKGQLNETRSALDKLRHRVFVELGEKW